MNSRIQFVVFGILVAISFSCLTDIEAGKFIIDFDQPNGKPKSVSAGNSFDWTPLQGKWSVQNKKYLQEDVKFTSTADCTTYHRSYIGDENWTDYTVEATVRIEESGPAAPILGIFFRVNGDDPKKGAAACNYYHFRLDQRATEGPCLIKSPNKIIKITKKKPCKPKTDYVLKAVVKGSSIKCYIDGKLEFDVKDDSFPKGAVGVGTFNAGASFDNLTVEGPGIKGNSTNVELGSNSVTNWGLIKQGYSFE